MPWWALTTMPEDALRHTPLFAALLPKPAPITQFADTHRLHDTIMLLQAERTAAAELRRTELQLSSPAPTTPRSASMSGSTRPSEESGHSLQSAVSGRLGRAVRLPDLAWALDTRYQLLEAVCAYGTLLKLPPETRLFRRGHRPGGAGKGNGVGGSEEQDHAVTVVLEGSVQLSITTRGAAGSSKVSCVAAVGGYPRVFGLFPTTHQVRMLVQGLESLTHALAQASYLFDASTESAAFVLSFPYRQMQALKAHLPAMTEGTHLCPLTFSSADC